MIYLVFRFLHLGGIFLLFTAVGGTVVRALLTSGGAAPPSNGARKLAAASHGVAMLAILIGGFGMLGVQHYGFPPWAWGKLAIWLIFGGIVAVIRKSRTAAVWLWWLLPLLGLAAAWLALAKPVW
jgi:hypothetical protein